MGVVYASGGRATAVDGLLKSVLTFGVAADSARTHKQVAHTAFSLQPTKADKYDIY